MRAQLQKWIGVINFIFFTCVQATQETVPQPPLMLKPDQNLPNDGPGALVMTRKKEPRYSLKPPFVAEDNTRWETGAGTTVESNFVRLTPAVPGRQGYLWSRIPVTMSDWEVILEARIHSEIQEGGEGMAFWYTKRKMLGPVFGSSDYWDGLGIMIDTHNRNTETSTHPMVTAIYNDGSQKYTAHDDGESMSIGACRTQIRNLDTTFGIRITYLNSFLSVEISNDRTPDGQMIFMPCITNVNIALGVDKFFGVSASTAHSGVGPTIFDNQEVYQLLTHDLTPDNAAELIRQKREDYRREIEEEHKQNTRHHDMSNEEFVRVVTASLQQMAGQLTQIDNLQIGIEKRVAEIADTDTDGGSGGIVRENQYQPIRMKVQETYSAASKLNGLLAKIGNPTPDKMDRRELRRQEKQEGRQGGKGGPALRQILEMQKTMKDDLRTLMTTTQTMENQQREGGQKDNFDPGQTIKDAVSGEFRTLTEMQTDAQRNTMLQFENIDALLRSASRSSGGGGGTFTTVILFILCILGGVQIYFQASATTKKSSW